MLSPSLSSTSLEQSSSTTISNTSFISPSKSSNSGLLISSPELRGNNGFPFLQHENNFSSQFPDNNYEYNAVSTSSVPYSLLPPSTSGGEHHGPLYVLNPCYQSPVVLRQSAGSSDVCNGVSYYELQQQQTLNFPQNSQSRGIGILQPRPVSTRRTVSLQVVRPLPISPASDNGSVAFLFNPQRPHGIPNRRSGQFGTPRSSYYDHRLLIANQNAAVVDWLAEVSLSRLFRQFHSEDGSANIIQLKKVQKMASNLRDKVRQIRGRGNLCLQPLTAISSTNQLFGMPLAVVQANTADGSPLPRFVHDLMDHIADEARTEGIFRTSGVRNRINDIKELCSVLSPSQPIPKQLLQESIIDLCDTLKRYFQHLPEPLFTDRMSQMLEDVVGELPADKHFLAVHYCTLALPAENRQALWQLLKFLNGVAAQSATNKMTCENLATCWWPTLFRFSRSTEAGGHNKENGPLSRRQRRKTVGDVLGGREKGVMDAISNILSQMIQHWEQLTGLPKCLEAELTHNAGLSICHDLRVPVKRDGHFEFSEELHLNFRHQLSRLKEDYRGGWRNWQLQRVFQDGSQLFIRPINDMIALKAFRIQTSIAAPPSLILAAILNRRYSWDSNVESCRRTGLSGQNFDIVRLQSTSALEKVENYTFLARRWTYGELDPDSICSLIECSIMPRGENGGGDGQQKHFGHHVSVYESKFLIVPICPGHSQLTYISRADLKLGRPTNWYDRVYGEMLAQQMRRLKANVLKCKTKFGGDSSTIV